MSDLDDFSIAARLLGSDCQAVQAKLTAIAAAESAAIAICRLDCAVDRITRPRPWLRLEELAGLAAAARAGGETVELVDLVRDRVGLRGAQDLTLGETAAELATRWLGNSDGMRKCEAFTAELLRPDPATGARPASLLALAIRLEGIARTAGWSRLPTRQIRIDPLARSAAIVPGAETSTIGDYVLAQAAAVARIGISKRTLPAVVASPALLTAVDGDALGRLTRWLLAIAAAAEAAHRRLERYRQFERRVEASLADKDKRRRTALAKVLALYADHWVLWPRRAASLSDVPHNTAWRAMHDAEADHLLCRVPGTFPGGAGMYVLAVVAEAAGLCPVVDNRVAPSPPQGELVLASLQALDDAEANIDRLIGSAEPSLFSLEDVEL